MRGGGGRPRVRLDIAGIQTTALIDTGSTHTIVKRAVYDKLPKLTPLYKAPILTSITDHELPIQGACTVKLAGKVTEVLICETLGVDALLGANFMKGTILDLSQDILVIGDKKYNLTTEPETRFCPLMAIGVLPLAPTQTIRKVLKAYEDVFSPKNTPVQVAQSLPPAVVDTGDHEPIRQKGYRLPFSKRQQAEQCINEMLRDGVIRPSDSPWASPITLVPKKDGTTRFCVDYRKLNSITRKDSHPLPNIQDVFDQLQGATIFSTLDLRSGYWQVPMHEDSISKTAFTCHLGLFEFVRMPFGLTNAPAIFQRAMNKILSGLTGKICMVYIDDIVVYSRNEAEHARHLEQVFERLRRAGLQLKPSKCHFGLAQIELLGYRVSGKGIQPLIDRVKAITEMTAPTSVTGVRSFLGMAGYYRQCIKDYARMAAPLTNLLKKREPFRWGPEETQAFQQIKQALTTAPILAHPDPKQPYQLYTDASNEAVGAILTQNDRGINRPVAYLSHKLSGPQLRWPTIEKEAYGIVYALKKFHPYLWGSEFTIFTDHKPLKSLFKSEIKNTKLQRWAIQIAEYGAPIQHIPGKKNVHADALSRIAAVTPIPEFTPPMVAPDDWRADLIDPEELARLQREEFPDEMQEAASDTDETRYIIEGGLLFTTAKPSVTSPLYLRLLLPHAYRQQVIDRCHEETGHAAFAKTLGRIQESYVWPAMRRHVREYLATCPHCRTLTPPRQKNPKGQMPVPPTAFHTWGIDLVGPFQRDRRGRRYLLTAIDHLTGWAEAIPIPSKKALTVQEAFMDHIVARYGIPTTIITDNGGEFVNKPFRKWTQEFGIEHRRTSPYNPRSNGMAEKFNGNIQKILLKLTGGDEKKWSKYLSQALYGYRISQGPGGLSPYQAVYGKKARLPRSTHGSPEEGDRIAAIRLAEALFRETRAKQKQEYATEEASKQNQLPPGSFVSLRVLNPHKGQAKYQPGYQIIRNYKGGLTLLDLETNKQIRVNQRNVRLIPQPKAYEEVDPPPSRRKVEDFIPPPTHAQPILPEFRHPLVTHVPAAAAVHPRSQTERALSPKYPSIRRRASPGYRGRLLYCTTPEGRTYINQNWDVWTRFVRNLTHAHTQEEAAQVTLNYQQHELFL